MPIVSPSSYQPPFYLRNGHLQTIFASLFRRCDATPYRRERIETDDGDFLDLDWSAIDSRRLGIISHGLEGNSHRPYVVGMVRKLNQNGWDALAWNYRSCSGEINRRLRFYHNGSIDDLDTVVRHVIQNKPYERIVLIGFSLGGNLSLVYLGSRAVRPPRQVVGATVYSVPCDLADSAKILAQVQCKPYMLKFLSSLRGKIRAKMKKMPDQINDHGFHQIKNFKHYDDRYTAPLHGFKNAEDYWEKCSSLGYIPNIRVPTLIVNALDDPFLGGGCYPYKAAPESPCVYLETPSAGGHVGFMQFNGDNSYWSENRSMEFIKKNMKG